MDEEDYCALIELVAKELRQSGAAEVANERHYTEPDPETGEHCLIPPQRRQIEMLEAFDRFLAIHDRKTYDDALASIADSVVGDAPQRVTIVLTADDSPREVDLREATELTPVRSTLQALVAPLRNDDPTPTISPGLK